MNRALLDLSSSTIRHGQAVPSRSPFALRKIFHNPKTRIDQQSNVRIHAHGSNFAYPNFKRINTPSTPGPQNYRHITAGWHSRTDTFGYQHNGIRKYNYATYRAPTTACSDNDGQIYTDHYQSPALENTPSDGSSPNVIRGFMSNIPNDPIWSSYLQPRFNDIPFTHMGAQRIFSMEHDYGRPRAFSNRHACNSNAVFHSKGYNNDQASTFHDLRMTKSRSLGSSAYYGTPTHDVTNPSAEKVASNVALKNNSDLFCDMHYIGCKRADIRTLWVASIQTASEEELEALFCPFGNIENIDLRSGASEGSRFAFIK